MHACYSVIQACRKLGKLRNGKLIVCVLGAGCALDSAKKFWDDPRRAVLHGDAYGAVLNTILIKNMRMRDVFDKSVVVEKSFVVDNRWSV
jgi:hypothetical protein